MIHICLVTESHLIDQTYFKIKNYVTYYTNYPFNNARGGSAILIKKSIEHFEEDKIRTVEFQTTTVTVITKHQQLSLTSVYSPPKHKIICEQYKNLIQKHKNRFIMGGDFNAKHTHWGSRLTTTKGRELLKALQKEGCDFISTGKPTYWPTDRDKIPDLIDFFIIKQVSKNFLLIEEGRDLNSDHSPINLSLSECVIMANPNIHLTNKHTDWQYFKALLDKNLKFNKLLTTKTELESEVLNFTQQIQNAAWESTPLVNKKSSEIKYPRLIMNLIAEKRKIRKKWQQTRYPLYKSQLNRLTELIRHQLKEFKNESFHRFVSELTADKQTE